MDNKQKIKSAYQPMESHKDDRNDGEKSYPHWDRILRDTDSLPVNSCKL